MNIFYLMHFEGKPTLTGSVVDMRIKAIHEIIQSKKLRSTSVIFSTAIRNAETRALRAQAIALGFKWYEFDKDVDTDDAGWHLFESALKDAGITKTAKMKRRVDNIIMCGTTLSGCVLFSKETSATQLSRKGYDVSLYLPACTEEEQPGATYPEKLYNSFELIYRHVRANDMLWDKLDIIASFNSLRNKLRF